MQTRVLQKYNYTSEFMTLRVLANGQDIRSHSHRRTITIEEHETFKPEVMEVLFTLESRRIFNESINMLNIDTDKQAVIRPQPDKISTVQ
jgi:hypothetical protein